MRSVPGTRWLLVSGARPRPRRFKCYTLARKLTRAKRSVSLVLARLRCGMLRLGGCVLNQRTSALLRSGGAGS